MMTSTAATPAAVPVTGSRSRNLVVPLASASVTRPASRTSPPAPVINAARRAAIRADSSACLNPIRRYDVIEVSSQNTNSVQIESAQTSPSIAVENDRRVAAKRVSPALVAVK